MRDNIIEMLRVIGIGLLFGIGFFGAVVIWSLILP